MRKFYWLIWNLEICLIRCRLFRGYGWLLKWFFGCIMEFYVVIFFESCVEDGESFVFVEFLECLCLDNLVVFNKYNIL